MPSPSEQYLLAQQPYFSPSAILNHEFYTIQNVQMSSVPVHHQATFPIVTPNASDTLIQYGPQHAPQQHPHSHPQAHPRQSQQYMQMMQQRYDSTSHTNYLPVEYHQLPDEQPTIAGYYLNFY
jgi:hypothetical protein